MKIAVPTDFSPCSKIAVQFALALSQQAQAEVILLHVLPKLGATVGRLPSTLFKEALLEEAENRFSELLAEMPTHNLTLTTQIAYGAGVENVIKSFIKTYGIDLVIMGSKGASGLKKILMGSSTVGVINNCRLPVIVVPEHAVMAPVTHLLYASDLKNITEEVKAILPFAQLLRATIKIIHVPPLQYLEQLDFERLLLNLREKTGYQKIDAELIEGKEIGIAIEQYAAASHGEMLTMFTHHTSFLEQIFSKSITREIVCHNNIPILVINNR